MEKLSIIIPAYNEAHTLRQLVEKILTVPFPVDYEIILVDDCSKDGTREMLKKRFGDGSGEVRVFYHSFL